MRSVVQRVDRAGVVIGERRVSEIGKGLLVLLGIERGDGERDADYLSDKISNLRIFEDREGKMNHSLIDIKGEMLVVSQFTLMGDCRKGRRPSFTDSENLVRAQLLYDYFIKKTKTLIRRVAQGQFQATMSIDLINNGPVTILLDSKRIF